jgi:hypothetical protein
MELALCSVVTRPSAAGVAATASAGTYAPANDLVAAWGTIYPSLTGGVPPCVLSLFVGIFELAQPLAAILGGSSHTLHMLYGAFMCETLHVHILGAGNSLVLNPACATSAAPQVQYMF